MSLPEVLAPDVPEGRSEKYVVYSVLDSMVATAFDALNEVDLMREDLAMKSTEMRGGRVQMATLREMISGLGRIRRRAGPQRGLFERIGLEIERLPRLQSDEERYFDRLGDQVNRLVDATDAAENGMATVIDLRLNETSYLLTVVATIFLPLTFITGFFGMNFDWMIAQVDTQLAFWLLGVGTSLVAVLLAWRLIVVRGSPDLVAHVEVRGSRLVLDCHGWTAGRDLEITLPGRAFRDIRLSGSSKLVMENVSQPNLALRISGSGSVRVQDSVDQATIKVSGSGEARLGDLAMKQLTVDISGSGKVEAAPKDTADVRISGSGDVKLLSRPANLTSKVSGSGRISQAAP